MRIAVTTSIAVLVAATAVFAQDEAGRKVALEIATRVPFEKATTRAPYSAETLVEGIQVLADGNRIVRKTTGRVYRDGEGRTRREEEGGAKSVSTGTGAVLLNVVTTISIVDPVGGFSYALDPEHKIAWRTPVVTATALMGKIEAATAEDRMKVETAAVAEKVKRAASEGPLSPADEQKLTE